jgi:hypothetical protein
MLWLSLRNGLNSRLIELEREDTTRDSQGGFQHTTSMVENSTVK